MALSRRAAVQTAAWTAVSWSRIAGANARLRVAGLGTGGRGQYLLRLLKANPEVEIAALCDVWPARLTQAQQALAPQSLTSIDYGELLAKPDIDAVVVAAPDHWHAPMTIAAVEAGKDVYVEKPITHSVGEGAAVVQAVRRSQRIVQVGYQQRSYPHMAEAREIIRAGQLGGVTLVETWWNQDHLAAAKPAAQPGDVHWDRFLGSATPRPFDPWRFAQWRFFWDYGGGSLTDLFSHWIETIHWLLDDAEPTSASAVGRKNHIQHWECPDTISAGLTYRKGHVVSYTSALVTRLLDGGMIFRGTEASLRLTREGYEIFSDKSSLAQKTFAPTADRTAPAGPDATGAHLQNWIDCVKSRQAPRSEVATAVAAADAAHQANNALRAGRNLTLPAREAAWRRLFDGRTFKGWIVDPKADIWNVREGMIVGRDVLAKRSESIRTDESFRNFELRLKVRLSAGRGQAAVRFRSYPTADPSEFSGFRVDIAEKNWGSLYDEARRNTYLARPPEEALAGLDGSNWIEYVIRADGHHITIALNGVTTVDYEERDPVALDRGFVGLEILPGGATLLQARDIEIREVY